MAERERLLVAEDDPPLRLAALALGAPLDARMQTVLGRYFLEPPDASVARLRQMAADAGLAGEVEPSVAAAGDLASQLAGVHYLLVESAEITDDVLTRGSALKLVQKHGEDTRNIDLAAAARRRVPVATHLRWANTAVAEHTLALILAVARRLFETHAAAIRPTGDVTRGDASYNWPRVDGLRSLRGLTLGLVGLGEIGRDVARKAASFRMPVLYTQRRRLGAALEVTFGAEFVSLPELLEASDIVSLHVPLTAETRGMIGARELARMRPGAILINTSRGALVDERALLAALGDGRLGGAGLDVRVEEPPADAASFVEFPTVVLSPHVAAGTGTELMSDVRDVLANVARARRGETPLGLVHS